MADAGGADALERRDDEFRELALEAWVSAIDERDRARVERRRRLVTALAWSAIPVWFVIDALLVWTDGWPGAFVVMVAALAALAIGGWVRWYRSHRVLEQLDEHVRRIDPAKPDERGA